jgi:AcrR family transcriptional regulator
VTDIGLRERKRERTREEIRQAALELFDRHGFDDTTIEQIADAADVGRRTFFRYFPTKQSVLFADAEEKAAQLAEAFAAQPLDQHPVRSAIGALEELIGVIEPQKARHQMFRTIVVEGVDVRSRHLEVNDRVKAGLAAAIAERLGVDLLADARPGAWAAVVMGCFSSAYQRWMADGDDGAPLRSLFAEAVAAVADGFD